MYEDVVTPPEHREAAGRDWYIKTLHNRRGEVDQVNLYDADGCFVAEFHTLEACEAYLERLEK